MSLCEEHGYKHSQQACQLTTNWLRYKLTSCSVALLLNLIGCNGQSVWEIKNSSDKHFSNDLGKGFSEGLKRLKTENKVFYVIPYSAMAI